MFGDKVQSFARELARNTLARAFAISVLVHILGISGVELGSRLGLWEMSLLPQSGKSRAAREMAKAEELLQEQIQRALQQAAPEVQLVFVEVDPSQAAPEPPKNTKYYSSQSTVASNPDPAEKEQPKIDGKQEQVVKTFDTLKPVAPVQPPPEPKTQPKNQPAQPRDLPQRPSLQEEPKPTREQKPGETLLARAAPRPQPPPPPPQQQRRPRTLAEARAQKGIIEGQKSRQEGGVRKHTLAHNLDVARTPFGAYDHAFIQAVQARWFSLLDQRGILGGEPGKVVVEFRLNADGRISALRVAETEVSDLLAWYCQAAILDPSPYRPFPSDLRRMLQHDYREIRFTFYYNQ